jgi:hypothetical protein
LFVTGGPTEDAIDRLLRQLEIGLPADALGIVDIPVDLGRGDYLALVNAGIRTVEQIWQHSDEQVLQMLGRLVGRLINSKRPKASTKAAAGSPSVEQSSAAI